jgi:hypothetical protein
MHRPFCISASVLKDDVEPDGSRQEFLPWKIAGGSPSLACLSFAGRRRIAWKKSFRLRARRTNYCLKEHERRVGTRTSSIEDAEESCQHNNFGKCVRAERKIAAGAPSLSCWSFAGQPRIVWKKSFRLRGKRTSTVDCSEEHKPRTTTIKVPQSIKGVGRL